MVANTLSVHQMHLAGELGPRNGQSLPGVSCSSVACTVLFCVTNLFDQALQTPVGPLSLQPYCMLPLATAFQFLSTFENGLCVTVLPLF